MFFIYQVVHHESAKNAFIKVKVRQLHHGSIQDEDHIPTMASKAQKDLLTMLPSFDLFPDLP